MAISAGKIYTAITAAYRLLKHAKVKRVPFLAGTKNLGEQAEKVCISIIQKMYSILRGEKLGESLERNAHDFENALNVKLGKKPVSAEYNESRTREFFDFIIIDECHRSIYNVWQ
jgi:type I restriction enzyme R subunit